MHAQNFTTEVHLVTVPDPMQGVRELQGVAVDLRRPTALNRKVTGDPEAQFLHVRRGGNIRAKVGNAERRTANEIGMIPVVRGRKAVEHVWRDRPRIAAGKALV